MTETHILTNRFIIFYRSNKDLLVMFYFFKEVQVFLYLLIQFLFFVFLFIKERIQWLAFFLFLLILFLYFVSFHNRMNSMASLPACQTSVHQTEYFNVSILMLIIFRLFGATIPYKLLLFWFFYLQTLLRSHRLLLVPMTSL